MKYGFHLRTKFTYSDIREQAFLAEKYGFDSVHIDDHFMGYGGSTIETPYLEAMIVMTAIAVETRKVDIGFSVLCNSYRNPALLAKMISTLDEISQGRSLLWIGAGWREEEYKAFSYPFPSAKERIDQLEEAIQIFKKLFTEEVTNFEGKYYKLENCRNFPKSVRKPYPPIVIGCVAKDRLATLSCRECDGINIGLWEVPRERIDFINRKLREFKRDLSKFEISIQTPITLVKNEKEKDDMLSKILESTKDKSLTKEKILKNNLISTTDEMRERIRAIERMGIKRIVTVVRGSKSIEDPLELFHEEIMKK